MLVEPLAAFYALEPSEIEMLQFDIKSLLSRRLLLQQIGIGVNFQQTHVHSPARCGGSRLERYYQQRRSDTHIDVRQAGVPAHFLDRSLEGHTGLRANFPKPFDSCLSILLIQLEPAEPLQPRDDIRVKYYDACFNAEIDVA